MRQFSALLLCTVIVAAAGCGKSGAPAAGGAAAPAGPLQVEAVTMQPQPLLDRIQALGTIKANESIEIRPRIESVVSRVLFEEDQLVAKDALLVELESSEIRADLAMAEAKLAESTSTYRRNLALRSKLAISESMLEQLLAARQVDEAAVNAARARLAHTRIVAPFAGRIGLRRVSPGGFVDTDTVITTLDDTATVKLDFSVPETFLPVIAAGATIAARSAVYPGRTFAGRVASIDTRVDPVTRSVTARAELPNADGALKPGMFLTVDLQRDRGMVLLAPEESIVPEGNRQYVYVVQDGIAHKREVTLGLRLPGSVEIREHLDAGDTIITEGTIKAHDGAAVQVVPATSGNDASPAPAAP